MAEAAAAYRPQASPSPPTPPRVPTGSASQTAATTAATSGCNSRLPDRDSERPRATAVSWVPGPGPPLGRLFVPVSNPPARQVVGRQVHRDPVPLQDADVVLAHLAAHVRQHLVPVFELHAERRVG